MKDPIRCAMVSTDGPVTFVFRVVGVEVFWVGSSQHILVVQRIARLAGSIRREAEYATGP